MGFSLALISTCVSIRSMHSSGSQIFWLQLILCCSVSIFKSCKGSLRSFPTRYSSDMLAEQMRLRAFLIQLPFICLQNCNLTLSALWVFFTCVNKQRWWHLSPALGYHMTKALGLGRGQFFSESCINVLKTCSLVPPFLLSYRKMEELSFRKEHEDQEGSVSEATVGYCDSFQWLIQFYLEAFFNYLKQMYDRVSLFLISFGNEVITGFNKI